MSRTARRRTCGAVPSDEAAAARMREELLTVWWSIGQAPGRVAETRHCGHCQPHTVFIVACLVCGDGPILSGQLAREVVDADPQQLPQTVVDELPRTGWQRVRATDCAGWVCCQAAGQSSSGPR